MRYTINHYNKPAEIVNTDLRYTKRQTITGDSFKATIDQRAKVRRARAKQAHSFRLPRLKSIIYAGIILYLIIWTAPRVRVGAPEQAQEPQQAQASADLPPSRTPEATATPEPDLFVKYFGDEADTARAICTAESGLNPDAVSKPNRDGSRDHGICQINDKWQADKFTNTAELLDKENNIKIAKQIRDEWGNFNAWSVYKSGKYKQFIK